METQRTTADNMLIEGCTHCNNVTAIDWDVDVLGYAFHCAHCGELNMFCDECDKKCFEMGYSPESDNCDWDMDSASCWRKRGEKCPPKQEEERKIDEHDFPYLAFVIYADRISTILDDLDAETSRDFIGDTDTIYEYCLHLARLFGGSDHDDPDYPLYECIYDFIDEHSDTIRKQLKSKFFC